MDILLHAYYEYVRGSSLEDTIFGTFYRHYYLLGCSFKPNAVGKTSHGLDCKINSYGFCGPEFELKKPPDIYRIVCFGGSTSHSGHYPKKLAYLLKDEHTISGKKFEVINAAVPTWDTTQSLIQFVTRVIYLDPDIIIIYEGINDYPMKAFYWFKNLPLVNYRAYGSFVRNHFIIYNIAYNTLLEANNQLENFLFERRLSGIPDGAMFDDNKITVTENDNLIFKTNIENFIILSRSRNIKIMLCPMALSFDEAYGKKKNLSLAKFYYAKDLELITTRVAGYNKILKEIAQQYDTVYLDVARIIKPGEENFVDLCHFTEKGARGVAKALKDKLKAEGIIE